MDLLGFYLIVSSISIILNIIIKNKEVKEITIQYTLLSMLGIILYFFMDISLELQLFLFVLVSPIYLTIYLKLYRINRE